MIQQSKLTSIHFAEVVLPDDEELPDLGADKIHALECALRYLCTEIALESLKSVSHSKHLATAPKFHGRQRQGRGYELEECIDGPAQIIIVIAGSNNREMVVEYIRRQANITIKHRINFNKWSQSCEVLTAT